MREKLRRLTGWSFFRFVVIGVLNSLLGMLIMFGLYNLAGCSYWLSTAANYGVTALIGFLANRHFTFHDTRSPWRLLPRFVLNILCCYAVAYGLAKPLAAWVLSFLPKETHENLAMLAGMGLCGLLNYLGQRHFVFRGRR